MSNKTDYNLIGLTGPTGSGKTLVSSVFSHHGFAVVDADSVAHKALMDPQCISSLAEAFGKDILNPDGSINRRATAAAAFSSKENTQKLNSITHPVILRLSLEEFQRLSQKGYKNIIFDAPTLFESGSHTLCHCIIAVTAPLKDRIKRITARDNISEADALARISAQKPDEFYTEKADFVIRNEGDKEALINRTAEIIKELSL